MKYDPPVLAKFNLVSYLQEADTEAQLFQEGGAHLHMTGVTECNAKKKTNGPLVTINKKGIQLHQRDVNVVTGA